MILTERTAHLKNHPAEISLPGGHIEDTDSGPEAAALRDAVGRLDKRIARVERGRAARRG